MGSQHEPPDCLGVWVIDTEGQISIADVHCILLGSQHPVKGVGLAEGEGDGVIVAVAAIRSEHNGSPGVHDPREGSQHLLPLKLESPVFVVWLSEPTTNAEMKTKRRNMFDLLSYTFFSEL